jgi:Immunoglobulin-like domain of bacterial spore germination
MRRLVLLAVGVAVLAAGCGSGKTVTVTTTETVTRIVTAPVAQKNVRVYLLRDGKVAPTGRVVAAPRGEVSADDLLELLRAGPSTKDRDAGLTSAPLDTRLGLAEIVYTLSQAAPSQPVTYQGKSYSRSDFEDETPAILVESPLPFQAVTAPLRVPGTANTFEATFEYELTDPDRKVLSHDFVTATSGSGTRGTFDFTIPFEAPNGLGNLIVYERSAADGSKTHMVEIPLSLPR